MRAFKLQVSGWVLLLLCAQRTVPLRSRWYHFALILLKKSATPGAF
jgi:hypothetical protein